MTIEDANVVDFITVDNESGDYWLSISDHLSWEKEAEHLLLLQEKVNSYLAFVENGELENGYPESRLKNVVINIGFKYPPPALALQFIELARTTLRGTGLELRTELPLVN